jgi:hypothetical protein
LDEQALDRHVQHYRELWAKAAEATSESVATGAQSGGAQRPRKLVDIDFPSAASIPPISIMNPEPAGPVLPGVAAAAAANPNPSRSGASASRHSRKPTVNAAAQTLAGSRTAPAGAVEPIWPEPIPTPPPPQVPGAAVQAASPSAGVGAAAVRAQ